MAISLHTNGLKFIKSIKAGRDFSGHMDHIFPLNKACYSMLVSLHQFFTKVCLSKHRDHLSTLHTTDSYYQASLWKAADFKIEIKWVYECALRIIRALCIKWTYLVNTWWSKPFRQSSHTTITTQFWLNFTSAGTYSFDWFRKKVSVSLDADKGKLQPFLFHVSMQKTRSPIGKGQKKGIARLTISEWKWWLEKASLIFKAQIKNTSLV